MATEPVFLGIESHHWLTYKTADVINNRPVYYISLTGVAKFDHLCSDLERSKNKQVTSWNRSFTVNVENALAEIPHLSKTGYRPQFKIKSWNAYGGLNDIFNDNKSYNSRHGISSFRLSTATNVVDTITALYTAKLRDLQTTTGSWFSQAEYESNAYIYRIGYQIDLLVYWGGGYVPV